MPLYVVVQKCYNPGSCSSQDLPHGTGHGAFCYFACHNNRITGRSACNACIDMNQSDHQDALADQDECQQKKLPASASMTIESSPSTVDGRKSAVAALATPAERLERELYRSRKFLQKMHLREDMPDDKANNADDERILSRHLESEIYNLKDEMEKAKHELMESSLRAEEYLADLSDIMDAERDDLMCPSSDIPLVEIDPSSHKVDDLTSTARSLDMEMVLLEGMARLKRELNDAKEEITRLRRHVSGIDSAKTHRRFLSDPTTGTTSNTTSNTTSIPTVVECFGEGSNACSQSTANTCMAREQYCTRDEFDDIVHQAYVASHLRISHGFVHNNWLEGDVYADGDDGDNDCVGGACFLGGLAEMLKRGSEGGQRKDVLRA